MKTEIWDSTSSSVKVSISAIALDTKSKDRRIIIEKDFVLVGLRNKSNVG
jgi:hypothetical protein